LQVASIERQLADRAFFDYLTQFRGLDLMSGVAATTVVDSVTAPMSISKSTRAF
jgi:hypothetical protein